MAPVDRGAARHRRRPGPPVVAAGGAAIPARRVRVVGGARPLQAMCDRWAGQFEDDYAAAQARGEDQLDPGLARAGIELFRQLPRTPGAQCC